MEPAEYEPVPDRIRVLTWPEASQADIEALAGAENVNAIPGGVQVRNADGEWFTLGAGWGVSVSPDGAGIVLSPAAIATRYRPVT
jgi:hypothetical protein